MPRHVLLRVLRSHSRRFRHCFRLRDCLFFLFAGCLLYVCVQVLDAARSVQLSLQAMHAMQGREAMRTLTVTRSTPGPSISLQDTEVVQDLVEVVSRLPNLPLLYSLKEPLKTNKDSKCAKYPSLYDITFNNIYWQVLHTSNGTFYLYSAFFDDREESPNNPSIRILGMADRITPAVTTHCQLWYEGEHEPVVTQVTEYKYIWVKAYGNYKNGIVQPYLLTCDVPADHKPRVPQSVSLVEGRCDKPSNNLRVINNLPPAGRKKNFAVCVKGVSGSEDNSLRIVEWLELLFLLGADKVFLYDMGVHPNMSKVFRFYESEGKVDVKGLTLPADQPNDPVLLNLYLKKKVVHKRQNELIPYNDCLYRNMNRYKFVILLDTDEVIMPRAARDWKALMKDVAPQVMSGNSHPKCSYVARHVYFLDAMQEEHGWAQDVPRHMHMLQHLYRASNYSSPGSYVKCFHDPQRIHTIHNHYPFSCLKKWCDYHDMRTDLVHLQHYRSECKSELKKVCPYYLNHTVLEDSILRFKEPLLRGTLGTLRHLGLITN